MAAKLVSLIGPPAVGKTTLAQLLCRALPARFIGEDWSGNPYLADSYGGPRASRLPGQLYFLRSRVRQLAASTWPRRGVCISDYGFCQDDIFARMRLRADEYRRYLNRAVALAGTVHRPDLLLLLDAPPGALLERLALRARDFERALDAEFLQALRAQYRRAAAGAACPVLALDCRRNDYRDDFRRQGLVRRLKAMLNIRT